MLRDNAKLVQEAIAEALGTALQVRFQTGGAPPRAKAAPLHERGKRSGRQPQSGAIAEDPDELFTYLNERIK